MLVTDGDILIMDMDGATLIMATDGVTHTTVMAGAILIILTTLITVTDGDIPITETTLITRALEDLIMHTELTEDILQVLITDILKTILTEEPIITTEEVLQAPQLQTALHLPEETIHSLKTTPPITILPEQEAAVTATLTDLLTTAQEVKATPPAHHDLITIQDHQAITAADLEEVLMAVEAVHTAVEAVAEDLLAVAEEDNHTHYF